MITRDGLLRVSRAYRCDARKLYSLWTDPAALSAWFGCRVEMGAPDRKPAVGDPVVFHFDDEVVRGVLEDLRPFETLAFTWNVGDTTTRVRVTFTPDLAAAAAGSVLATRMTLEHDGLQGLPFSDTKLHHWGWSDYFDGLEARVPHVREVGVEPARAAGLLEATPESVWDAWFDAEGFARWYVVPPQGEVSFSEVFPEGGRWYDFHIIVADPRGNSHPCYGKHQVKERGVRLHMSFVSDFTAGRTELRLELSRRPDGGTAWDLVHEGLPDRAEAQAVAVGWGEAMERLGGQLAGH